MGFSSTYEHPFLMSKAVVRYNTSNKLYGSIVPWNLARYRSMFWRNNTGTSSFLMPNYHLQSALKISG